MRTTSCTDITLIDITDAFTATPPDTALQNHILETLEEAVRKDPENCQLRFKFGFLLACKKDFITAMPHLERAANLNPNESLFRETAGACLLKLSKPPHHIDTKLHMGRLELTGIH